MSDQPENGNQQTITPEEVRQALLTELDASKQAIEALSDEELEAITGAGATWDGVKLEYGLSRDAGNGRIKSAYRALRYGPDIKEMHTVIRN